ncbi:MAG: UDP-3-O-(3-hydroxymyristoyl)glucosamine N-acyltransferase [Marinagarivorans sp.]|nr:UDP-3-O-(3-hydroxymyristoyl)glucosamine N-acyltransferase [Marinagarivorans sp.]
MFTLAEIALLLDGTLMGDGALPIAGIADVSAAKANEITFISNKKYLPQLEFSNAGAVLLSASLDSSLVANQVIVADPYLAFAKLSLIFDNRPKTALGIHPHAHIDSRATPAVELMQLRWSCVVDADAVIGDGTELCAGSVIGPNARLGQNCLIHANATICHNCILGDNVKIHSGSTIGSDGFGYASSKQEGWVKIYQLGRVVIGNNVEIGANCAIDRGAINDTIIADGVIIDNLVHIAHNVQIGKRTAIAGCVGIAGSTVIGAGCTMGGFVAINGHLTIADNVHFNGGTVVTKSIDEPGHYASGSPMQDVRAWRRNMVRVSQLDEWVGRIKKLENQ